MLCLYENAFNPQSNGAADSFNADKNGFNSSTNTSLVNAVNGGSGGAVVGSTNGKTPNLLGDGKKAFSPEQTSKQFKESFSNFGDDIITGINAAGDAVGAYMGDTAGDIKDAVVGANDDLQTMLLVGGAILLVVLLMDD
jgi:hypothetical protein